MSCDQVPLRLEYIFFQRLFPFYIKANNVAHLHHLDADPDPACHFDADPDPTFHFDPNPDPSFKKQMLKTSKKSSNRLIFHTFWLVICKLIRIRNTDWHECIGMNVLKTLNDLTYTMPCWAASKEI
jgi:hypothetical protein